MKYKCLVLDHDDTVVDSTASIHFPAFVEYLRIRRPSLADRYTLEDYFRYNFDPGVVEFFEKHVGLSDWELVEEEAFWREYVKDHIPNAYSGMKKIIERFRAEGGVVAVDSHSYTSYIERDYRENGLPMPDVIYGWDLPPVQRKPSPYTLFDLMHRYSLTERDILVLDDLKPGYDMARGAGVDFAAAGWAHDIPEIEGFMCAHCDYYFKTREELFDFLFA